MALPLCIYRHENRCYRQNGDWYVVLRSIVTVFPSSNLEKLLGKCQKYDFSVGNLGLLTTSSLLCVAHRKHKAHVKSLICYSWLNNSNFWLSISKVHHMWHNFHEIESGTSDMKKKETRKHCRWSRFKLFLIHSLILVNCSKLTAVKNNSLWMNSGRYSS